MAPRDDTKINFTIADRLLAEKTANAVEDIKGDLKAFLQKFDEYIKTNDTKVDVIYNDHKVFKRTIKIVASIIGGLITLAATIKAYF